MNAIALFSYALVEKDRVDWHEHIMKLTGVPPDHTAIEKWFSDKPDQYFLEKYNIAFSWFSGFSRILLHEEIESGKRAAIDAALGDLKRFWPPFWLGNLVGLTSNIVFTFIVVLFVAFISSDFSFIAWTKRLFGAH